tara:strand:- start:3287 stop:3580 length:294 start_codon:yes stop_codon:yes gene_type:complete
MKRKTVNTLIWPLLVSLFLFFQGESTARSQEVPCTAPTGFVCGSTEGTVWEITWIFPSMGIPSVPVPIFISKKCCVESVASNACNAQSVGCSEVTMQ